MRNLKQIMLFVMVGSLLTFTSCSSEDDEEGGSSGGDEFVTAKVDGSDFASAKIPAVIVGAQSTNGILAVQGGDNNGNTINFAIQNYTGIGTYTTGDNISNNNLIQYLQVSPSLATWLSSGVTSLVGGLTPGTIEITSDNGTTVEGTFSFDGYNGTDMTTKTVTSGKFKAKFD